MKTNQIGSISYIAFAGLLHFVDKEMSSSIVEASSSIKDVSNSSTDVNSSNTVVNSLSMEDVSSPSTDVSIAKLLAFFINIL